MNQRAQSSTAITAVTSAILIFASHSAHALHFSQPNANDPYFQVSTVTTTLESQADQPIDDDDATSCALDLERARANKNFFATAESGVDPMAIADLLFKVWDIVKDGKPVVTVDSKSASALPNLAEGDWRRLTGWKRERSTTFKVEVKNLYNTSTVVFKYSLKMIYGGGVGGKGLYIASARIQPVQIKALWGYNFDVSVNVPAVVNQGTEDDPMAAMYLDLNYQISTWLKSETGGESYLIQGDGLMMDTKTERVFFDGDARTALKTPRLN